MTLKIKRIAGKRKTRICLSGQLRSEHLDQLKSEVARGGPRVTLDLEELDLVAQQRQLVDRAGAFRGRLRGGCSAGRVPLHGPVAGADLHRLVHPQGHVARLEVQAHLVHGGDRRRSINPDQERMMAKRANTKTVEVNASHVAYMSHPKETVELIEEAATSARSNQ
jgi:hypothetical protein